MGRFASTARCRPHLRTRECRMRRFDDGSDTTIQLTAAGVTVLIDASGARLPALVHWGPELPALSPGQATAIVTAAVPATGSNALDTPPRVPILPGHHAGWSGRPGLRGSFAGRCWSPAFLTRELT